jgi:hypothetical protein
VARLELGLGSAPLLTPLVCAQNNSVALWPPYEVAPLEIFFDSAPSSPTRIKRILKNASPNPSAPSSSESDALLQVSARRSYSDPRPIASRGAYASEASAKEALHCGRSGQAMGCRGGGGRTTPAADEVLLVPERRECPSAAEAGC